MIRRQAVFTRNVLCAFAITPNKLGGCEQFAIEIAHQIQPLGYQFILCLEGEPSPGVRKALLEPGNMVLEVLPRQAKIDLKSSVRFTKLLLKYRPEAILYSLGGVVRLWPLLAKVAGVQRILYNDGTSRKRLDYRASTAIRMLMMPLTQVVCVSCFVKECSDREGIVPTHKTSVIYNSAALNKPTGNGAIFRKRYGISDQKIVILKVSWLVQEKGIDVALLAAREALKQNRDLHFLFCGDGREKERYETTAKKFGIENHITWAGQIEDIGASGAFQAADIQIQCSQWHEAFCLGVAEGMSSGLPVVAAKIGGLPELVTDGVNGYLFEPRDFHTLARRIVELAGDKSLREQIGHNNREKAIAAFDLKKNVSRWVEMLVPNRPSAKLAARELISTTKGRTIVRV